MADHLSALLLDTLAAQLPVEAAASAHLAGCADCRARLEALEAERASLLGSERSRAVLGRLTAPRRTVPRWAPVLVALAAALLVLVTTRLLGTGDGGVLLKGAPTVELLKDGAPVTRARVGDRLGLSVGAAGQRAVAVFTVDERGEVSALLPSTPVAAGARVMIGGGLEVTAGSLTLFACFGEPPLGLDSLQLELRAAIARTGGAPLEAAAPKGCARTRLQVLP